MAGVSPIVLAVPVVALVTLIYAFTRATWVARQDAGNERIQLIGKWISRGAMAFLWREYRTLAIFVVVVALLLGISNHYVSHETTYSIAIAFILGAACSALAGYFG